MSVRRLAEDSIQPSGFAFAGDNVGWAERTIKKYPEGRQQSAVIPLLMRAQDQDGWVTKAAIEHIASMLKMPLIRVLEVATFYTQFQLKPVGTRAHIQVCGTTPCMLRGSDALKDVCRSRIHEEQFHLNESGTLSWEEVECLGACVNAPMVMVFKDTFEDLTPEKLEELIDAMERGEDVKAGPQIDRQLSAPFGGPTTLNSDAAGEPDSEQSQETTSSQNTGVSGAVPPSNAGRPDTSAPETDPTISAPGKAVHANVNQAVERENRIEPAKGAGPGAGNTGGTQKGPTGAAEKEAGLKENAGSASSDADETRRDGRLGVQGEKDERAVVASDRFAEPPVEVGDKPVPASNGAVSTGGPLEATRVSDDVIAAPPVAGNEPPVGTGGDAVEGVPGVTVTPTGAVDADGRKIVGEKPEGLMASADGQKDDLQVIKGIGPVIEAKLNDLGVFYFRQIAAWTTKELVWIDDYLNFRGRAVRENWVSQAADLDAKRPETK